MKRMWVGMLLASLPVALLAQPLDRRPPSRDGWFNPTTPPDNPRPSGDGWFNPTTPPDNSVNARPLPPPDNSSVQPPRDNSVIVAPPPPNDGTVVPVPPDNSVTATPLPPPPTGQTDGSQEMVPNPLDSPNAPPAPGGSKQAQPKGQPVRGAWVQMGSATLQALDKVNAIQKTLVVKVGDIGHFDSLDIAVRGCFVRSPDVPADATAFLVIRDQRPDTPSFTGWMVRSAPYMSMLAHPIYDIRISGCSP
jgi:hypothetical protein